MKNFLFLSITICTLLSCKQNEAKVESEPNPTVAKKISDLKPLGREEIIGLYETADFVDYIFFDYDFSMNQGDQNAVKASVTFISDQMPVNIPANCKATGRIIFQSKGEIVREADLYFSDNCHYYQFVDESNKPMHRNQMTDQGIAFYNQMFSQA